MNKLYFLFAALFVACQDTRSFENVRRLKSGMTIEQVERFMGKPLNYQYVNDSTEKRTYVYDNAGNGIDNYIEVTFELDKVKLIKNKR